MQTTTRWGFTTPDLTGDSPDVPYWMRQLALQLDGVAMDDQGVLAARPTSTPSTPGKKGRYWLVTGDPDATQNGRLWRDNGAGWDEVPVGAGQRAEVGDYKYSLQPSSHGSRPDGLYAWLLADGSEVPAGYTQLLSLLGGHPFGLGGSGRPLLPDFRQRVPLMPGNPGSGLSNRGLGVAGGEEAHALAQAELPNYGLPVTDPKHAHGYLDQGGSTGGVFMATPTNPSRTTYTTATGGVSAGTSTSTGSSSTGISVSSGGSDAPHNNMPPYLVGGSFFVKT